MRPEIAIVVLAAGGSTRLGASKQLLLDEHDRPLVYRAARMALDLRAGPVIVVVGADSLRVREAVRELPLEVVENTAWRDGMGSSVRTGVQAAMQHHDACSALLLMNCDMPAVSEAHLRLLVERSAAGATRVASAYDGAVGNPAVVSREEWPHLLALEGDRGAKALFMRDGTATVPLAGGALDLDTPADVARWRTGQAGSVGDAAPPR